MSAEMDGSAASVQVYPPRFSDDLSKPRPVLCLTFIFVAAGARMHTHTHTPMKFHFKQCLPPRHNTAPLAVVRPRLTPAR